MKKRILMVSFRYPWPLYGYTSRMINIAKNHTVDLITLVDKKYPEESLKDLKETFNQVICIHHPKTREYFSTIKAFLTSRPLQIGYYYSSKMFYWLKKNHQNYDLLYFNTIRTAEHAKGLKVPKVLDFVDAISLNYNSGKKLANLFWKIIYRIEALRTLKYELSLFKEEVFDKYFISSPFDKEYLEKNIGYSLNNLIILPNGVKKELLERKLIQEENNWISFLGKMNYQPNEDAVIYFSKNIFPEIRKQNPGIKFYIVGMDPSKRVQKLSKEKGIRITGFLKDPYLILEKSKIIIAPLRFGGGTPYKVLESMALGKLVITSPIGARGIQGVKDNENLLIINPENFPLMVEKIKELILNPGERRKIGAKAKKLVEENYTWERINKKLLISLESFLNK